ncbi:Protein of unknown function DUF3067 [Cynara cardunculus var. scolymus]|uniref:Uncharacterized protein n=1 Tax=Cynara cardunculus var. scolymus TaxID=59895 RepID=A0A103Y3E1_CYNCS|nr:Protein of unknown function DUF3067 [Cynara cardunculus var. scolymus]
MKRKKKGGKRRGLREKGSLVTMHYGVALGSSMFPLLYDAHYVGLQKRIQVNWTIVFPRRSYDAQLIKKRSFPLTEEEYLLRLDDVANTLKCWGLVSHIRNSLEKSKE